MVDQRQAERARASGPLVQQQRQQAQQRRPGRHDADARRSAGSSPAASGRSAAAGPGSLRRLSFIALPQDQEPGPAADRAPRPPAAAARAAAQPRHRTIRPRRPDGQRDHARTPAPRVRARRRPVHGHQRRRRAARRAPRASARRAYRMKARSGPPWSSTITSWIIVSSRCVFGSSTGMRRFSARSTTKQRRGHEHQRRPAPGQRAARRRRRCRDSDRLPRTCAPAPPGRGAAPARPARRTAPRGWRPCPRSSSRCPAPRAP